MKLKRVDRILIQNLILFVLSVGIVTTLSGQPSAVAAQTGELVAIDRSAQINVRARASTTAPLVGFDYVGDRVQILNQTQGDDGYTWYQVQSDRSEINGWVRGDLVRLIAAAPQPKAYPSVFSATAPAKPSAPVFTTAIQKNPTIPQSSNCAVVYPVRVPIINQGFGQVPDPTNPGHTHLHTGLDFDGRIGDPINSPVCGVVVYVGREQNEADYEWGYGWHIKIRDSVGRIHLFGHISKAHVRVGDTVTPGQLIADIGNNGNSTGSHLHYEIRQGADDHDHAINPTPFLAHAGAGGVSQAGVPVTAPRSQTPLRF